MLSSRNDVLSSRNEERGTRKEDTPGSDISRSSLLVPPSSNKQSYAEHKEQQKRLNKAEKAVKESEKKIEQMEARLKELDELLCDPKNASDMTLVTEYTDTKRQLDEETERFFELSEELEELKN